MPMHVGEDINVNEKTFDDELHTTHTRNIHCSMRNLCRLRAATTNTISSHVQVVASGLAFGTGLLYASMVSIPAPPVSPTTS